MSARSARTAAGWSERTSSGAGNACGVWTGRQGPGRNHPEETAVSAAPPSRLMLVLVLAAAVVYVVTVIDAGRLARGEAQLLTTRMLLYAATGLMVLTVLVLVVSSLRITRF